LIDLPFLHLLKVMPSLSHSPWTLNLRLGAYYNAATPKYGGADWQVRFQFQFLLPEQLLSWL
jgi:hypothetical protein